MAEFTIKNMTKEELIKKIDDYNKKSNIILTNIEQFINRYIEIYGGVDVAYTEIVKIIIREYIILKYLKDIHTWDERIESIVDENLFRNMNNIIDSIIKSYDNNLDNILDYIIKQLNKEN